MPGLGAREATQQRGIAVVAADFALGAGFGSTASVAVAAGSDDRRGQIAVTAAGSGFAQATATVTLTFKRGGYAAVPFAQVTVVSDTSAAGETAYAQATATTLVITHQVLPVTAKVYTYTYFIEP